MHVKTHKTMKKLFYTFVALCCSVIATATDYYKITTFPIDGATMRDTFLIVVEYAGNTYIWNGQEASNKNYVCLEHYSNTTISGNYKENEVAIMRNQYYPASYKKLFSLLSRGDGDREDKGGYYVAGVGGDNGITFNAGQMDAEIELQSNGIHIATKSGVGVFRFNITPNDPHGFKFYEHDINMLHPTLYVKGNIDRYQPIVSGGGTTSVNQLNGQSSMSNVKYIKNGQLFIQQGDKTYNAQGARVE